MAQDVQARRHDTSTVLVATDNCRRRGHRLADVPLDASSEKAVICVTCTEAWGHQAGLKAWQENCPCCVSAAHPNGLSDLGITAALRTLGIVPPEPA
jgi:hypothetical protein